ncbi:MAG TPA: hypothetical protein VGL65_08855 [Gemmatimonadales bacterium]
MELKTKVVGVTVVVAVFGFLTESHAPLGVFWRAAPGVPDPVGVQLALFMLLGAIEAAALGLGTAFLVFGYPPLDALVSLPARTTRSAHLAISWLLMNWWAHDSFHQHVGMSLTGLLGIEYAFHATLIVAGLVLVNFFLAVVQTPVTAGLEDSRENICIGVAATEV